VKEDNGGIVMSHMTKATLTLTDMNLARKALTTMGKNIEVAEQGKKITMRAGGRSADVDIRIKDENIGFTLVDGKIEVCADWYSRKHGSGGELFIGEFETNYTMEFVKTRAAREGYHINDIKKETTGALTVMISD
jgi:hypothetical protein